MKEFQDWAGYVLGYASVVLICILVVALFASIWVKFAIGLLIAAFTFVSWTLIGAGISFVITKWWKF